MRSRNAYPGLAPEIIKQIRYHAWRLKQLPCFARQEIEDLEQDLLGEIWPTLARHNKNRSKLSTYVSRIASRRSITLIQRQLRLKRGSRFSMVSLEAEDETGQTLLDQLADSHCFEGKSTLCLDIAGAVSHLPETHQVLCEQLKTYTITEISRLNTRSRASIYRDLETMRVTFFPLYLSIRNPDHFFFEF
jgi:DNA-directed RNA polymerase specialized sigma24 family protein